MTTSLNLARVQVTSSGLTTATTAYTIGDVLGAEQFIVLPGNLTDAILMSITALDEGDVLGAIDVWFASAAFSLGSDNAAPSISDANARLIGGWVPLPAPYDLGGCRVATTDSIGLPLHADVGATGIAFRCITQTANAVFTAATDLKLTFGFSLDT